MAPQLTHNPELIQSGNRRHVPYGRIDSELVYSQEGKPLEESLQRLGYVLKERQFSEIKFLTINSEDHKRFCFPYKDEDGVYIGAEHCNQANTTEEILKKRCNLTFFGNLEARLNGEDVIVMASSMGHSHPLHLPVQEVYEFQGYGAMVIEKDHKIDFVFMRPGGKVAVPGECNMTLYNLSLSPLETHDFANPRQNEGQKDLQRQKGPMFCIYYSPSKKTAFFNFNPKYSNSAIPLTFSIPVYDLEGDTLGESLFDRTKDSSFKRQFGEINAITCDEYPLPSCIPRNVRLEENLEKKTPEFLSLFNIK